MQELSTLDEILDNWDRLLREYPAMKRELLEEIGQKMLSDVRDALGASEHVGGWQERYLGSRNGYAAVRAKAKTYKVTAGGKQYAVGYVTNAIESGHKHRRPSQMKRAGYTYRPRINYASVPGKHFYASVRGRLGSMGRDELARFAQEIAGRLEGSA